MNFHFQDSGVGVRTCAAVLLKFFALFSGDQQRSEALTIEILAKHLHNFQGQDRELDQVLLLHLAVQHLRDGTHPSGTSVREQGKADILLNALATLDTEKRIAAILAGAFSLKSSQIAVIMNLEAHRAATLTLSALRELRTAMAKQRLLSSSARVPYQR